MSYISQLMQKKYRERKKVQDERSRQAAPLLQTKKVTVPAVGKNIQFAPLDKHVVSLLEPKGLAAEEYRILRTNIQKLKSKRPLKTIMVTSALPGEGKTLTSVNLAVVMAQDVGKRILLADCDLRRGDVHNLLGFKPQEGLADVLTNGTESSSALYNTPVSNLTVMPCGQVPENPSELLGSSKMRGLMDNLKLGFDTCILDAPPALAITDVAVLASQVDGVILVIQAGKTSVDMVKEALGVLKRSHAHILGYLLVGVDDPDPRHNHRYYRYVYEAQKASRAQ